MAAGTRCAAASASGFAGPGREWMPRPRHPSHLQALCGLCRTRVQGSVCPSSDRTPPTCVPSQSRRHAPHRQAPGIQGSGRSISPQRERPDAPAGPHQLDAPLRGLMNARDSWLARFSARFSLSEDFATFLASRARGALPDMMTRFPCSADGEQMTIASFPGKSTRRERRQKISADLPFFGTALW